MSFVAGDPMAGGGGILDDDQAGLIEKQEVSFQRRAYDAMVNIMHDMTRDTNMSLALLSVYWIFDVLFMLVLPLGPGLAQAWNLHERNSAAKPSAIMNAIWMFLGPLWWTPASGEHLSVGIDYVAAYTFFAAWMGVTIVTVAWIFIGHMGWVEYKPKWMTMFLRVSARAATHALWFPIMLNLFGPFACSMGRHAHWFHTPLPCFQGQHLGMVIGSALLLPLTLVWHLLVSITYINREPDFTGKKNLLAASHGRVHALVLLLKAILAAFYVFAEDTLNVWVFTLVVLAGGLAWAWLYWTFLPFHSKALNGLQVAAASAYCAACLCALVAAGLGMDGAGPHTGAIAWLLLLPTMIFSGWALVAARTRSLAAGVTSSNHELELSNPYLVDLRIRCMIAEAVLSGHDPRMSSQSQRERAAEADSLFDSEGRVRRGSKEFDPTSTGGGRGGATDGQQQEINIDDMDAASIRAESNRLWMDASRAFGQSSVLNMFWAAFHASVTKNAHLERIRLRAAVEKADWSQIDIHFFCASRLRHIEEEENRSGASKMNVERRMRFEKLQALSRIAVANARGSVLAFWSELASKHPDLQKLKTLGASINATLAECNANFRELLELAPQNASVMRMYAEYLLELANDPKKAQELLADAEQIEEDASKVHLNAVTTAIVNGMPCGEFDLSADSVALLKVSSEADKLGSIYHVNGHACKLFGYSRREMLSRGLSDLIPPPIGAVHNAIVQRFLDTGTVRMMGSNRITFILHRAGYMLPAKINIRAALDGFAAVLDLAATPPGEMYVWALGGAQGWRVTSACENAMGFLGVDSAAVKAGSVSLTRFLSDAEERIGDALEAEPEQGYVCSLSNTAAAAQAGEASRSTAAATSLALSTLKSNASAWAASTSNRTGKSPRTVLNSLDGKGGVWVCLRVDVMHTVALGAPLYMLRLKRSAPPAQDVKASKRSSSSKKSPLKSAMKQSRGRAASSGNDDDDAIALEVASSRSSASGSPSRSPSPSPSEGDSSGPDEKVGTSAAPKGRSGKRSSKKRASRGRSTSASSSSERDTTSARSTSQEGSVSSRDSGGRSRKQGGASGKKKVSKSSQVSPKERYSKSTLSVKGRQASTESTSRAARAGQSKGHKGEHGAGTGLNKAHAPAWHGVVSSDADIRSCPVVGPLSSSAPSGGPTRGAGVSKRTTAASSIPALPLPGAVASASPAPAKEKTRQGHESSGSDSESVGSVGSGLSPRRPSQSQSQGAQGAQPHVGSSASFGLRGPSAPHGEGNRFVSSPRTGEGEGADEFRASSVVGSVTSGAPGTGSAVLKHTLSFAAKKAEGSRPAGIYPPMNRAPSRGILVSKGRPHTGGSVDGTQGGGGGDKDSATGGPRTGLTGLNAAIIRKSSLDSAALAAAVGRAAAVEAAGIAADGEDDKNLDSSRGGGRSARAKQFAQGLLNSASSALQSGKKKGDTDKSSGVHHRSGNTAISGGTGGSGTSATSITEILRRGVMARTGRLETSLRLTKSAVLIAFFATALLNLVSMLVTQSLLFQMFANLNLVHKNGQRAVLAQRMYSTVQGWAMAQAGLAEQVDMRTAAPKMSSYAEQFEGLHQGLYKSVDGSLPEEKFLYVSGSSITVDELIPGQNNSLELNLFRTNNRTLNLGNVGIEFVSRVRRVLQMNETAIRYADPDVFWIVKNGGSSIRTSLNQSMMLANRRSQNQGTLMKQADVIILAVSECVFVAIMVCVMLPAVLKVVASHHAVFQTFIQVPLPIIKALRASVQRRINAIARAAEEAEVGIDIGGRGNEVEDDDHDMHALLNKHHTREDSEDDRSSHADQTTDPRSGTVSGALKKYSRNKELREMLAKQTGADEEEEEEKNNGGSMTSFTRLFARVGVTEVSGSQVSGGGMHSSAELSTGAGGERPAKSKTGSFMLRKSSRQYRRAGSDMVINLLAFVWPILLYMLYFVIMWWWKGTMVDEVTTQKATLLWQAQAEMYMNLATIRVRFAAAGCDPVYLRDELNAASSDLSFAEYLVDAVLYGSAERNLVSTIQAGKPPLPQLWTSDGCVPNDDWFYSMQECRSFGSGITAKGLLGAFRSYGDYSRQLITERQSAVGDPNCRPMRMNDAGSVASLVNKFGSELLAVGFAEATKLSYQAPTDFINSFYASYQLIVALTILALVAFWVAFYVPLVSRLDKDIKNVRLLLLLFPDEVARGVPAIVEAGRLLLSEAGSSAGSVAGSMVR